MGSLNDNETNYNSIEELFEREKRINQIKTEIKLKEHELNTMANKIKEDSQTNEYLNDVLGEVIEYKKSMDNIKEQQAINMRKLIKYLETNMSDENLTNVKLTKIQKERDDITKKLNLVLLDMKGLNAGEMDESFD
jgi:hypothetical protein